MRKYSSVMLLCFLGAAVLQAQDQQNSPVRWTQFRGEAGRGIADSTMKLPEGVGPGNKVLWTVSIPSGHSSPCIWGDELYLTAGDKKSKTLETLCLNRKTGAMRWRKSVTVPELETMHELNTPASSTPTTDGERVYAYFGSFGLLCYDRQGQEVWRLPLKPVPGRFGSAASPVVAGDLVYVHTGNTFSYSVLAVDKKSGKQVWKKDRPRGASTGLYSSPTVFAGKSGPVVLTLGGTQMTAYDAGSGAEIWKLPMNATSAPNTPAVAENLAIFSISNPFGDPDNILQIPNFSEALKQYDQNKDGQLQIGEVPADFNVFTRGREDKVGDWSPLRDMVKRGDRNRDGVVQEEEWKSLQDNLSRIRGSAQFATWCVRIPEGSAAKPEIVWKQTRAVPEVPSPLIYQERVYLLSEKGIITCRELQSGKELYQSRLPMRGTCYASPVACDGKICVASDRGTFLVLKAGDKLEILHKAAFDEGIVATPALVDGRMYLRTESTLWSFGNPK